MLEILLKILHHFPTLRSKNLSSHPKLEICLLLKILKSKTSLFGCWLKFFLLTIFSFQNPNLKSEFHLFLTLLLPLYLPDLKQTKLFSTSTFSKNNTNSKTLHYSRKIPPTLLFLKNNISHTFTSTLSQIITSRIKNLKPLS